jgi:hypothetical protein
LERGSPGGRGLHWRGDHQGEGVYIGEGINRGEGAYVREGINRGRGYMGVRIKEVGVQRR